MTQRIRVRMVHKSNLQEVVEMKNGIISCEIYKP